MKTLHVLSPGPVGGAETVATNLVRALTAAEHPAAIAAIVDAPDHPYVVSVRSRGVDVVEIREGSRKYHRQAAAIADAARMTGSQIIHTHGYLADVMGNWAGAKSGLPVVSTLHGFTVAGRRAYLYDIPLRWAHRHADAVIAVSPPIVAKLQSRGVNPSRIHLIPNAWYRNDAILDRAAARRSLGIDDDGFRVGWVGRLSPEKGADVFVDAIAALRNRAITASVIGGGREQESLAARAAAANIGDRIRWHGLVPFADRYLRAFDVLALTSRTEGTPMVLLEAMAAGVPIVSTAVGGVPHMLSPDEAILVQSERADLVAAAIDACAADPAAAEARAQAAVKRVERDYDAAVWTRQHIDLYRSLLNSR